MALIKNLDKQKQFDVIDSWMKDFDNRFVESGWKATQENFIRPNVVSTIEAFRHLPNAKDVNVDITPEGALDVSFTYTSGRRVFYEKERGVFTHTSEQFRGTEYEVPVGFRIDKYGAVLVGPEKNLVLSPGMRYDKKTKGYEPVGGKDIFRALEEAINKGGYQFQSAQREAATLSAGSFVNPIYELDERDPLINIMSTYRKTLVERYGAQAFGSDLEQMAMAPFVRSYMSKKFAVKEGMANIERFGGGRAFPTKGSGGTEGFSLGYAFPSLFNVPGATIGRDLGQGNWEIVGVNRGLGKLWKANKASFNEIVGLQDMTVAGRRLRTADIPLGGPTMDRMRGVLSPEVVVGWQFGMPWGSGGGAIPEYVRGNMTINRSANFMLPFQQKSIPQMMAQLQDFTQRDSLPTSKMFLTDQGYVGNIDLKHFQNARLQDFNVMLPIGYKQRVEQFFKADESGQYAGLENNITFLKSLQAPAIAFNYQLERSLGSAVLSNKRGGRKRGEAVTGQGTTWANFIDTLIAQERGMDINYIPRTAQLGTMEGEKIPIVQAAETSLAALESMRSGLFENDRVDPRHAAAAEAIFQQLGITDGKYLQVRSAEEYETVRKLYNTVYGMPGDKIDFGRDVDEALSHWRKVKGYGYFDVSDISQRKGLPPLDVSAMWASQDKAISTELMGLANPQAYLFMKRDLSNVSFTNIPEAERGPLRSRIEKELADYEGMVSELYPEGKRPKVGMSPWDLQFRREGDTYVLAGVPQSGSFVRRVALQRSQFAADQSLNNPHLSPPLNVGYFELINSEMYKNALVSYPKGARQQRDSLQLIYSALYWESKNQIQYENKGSFNERLAANAIGESQYGTLRHLYRQAIPAQELVGGANSYQFVNERTGKSVSGNFFDVSLARARASYGNEMLSLYESESTAPGVREMAKRQLALLKSSATSGTGGWKPPSEYLNRGMIETVEGAGLGERMIKTAEGDLYPGISSMATTIGSTNPALFEDLQRLLRGGVDPSGNNFGLLRPEVIRKDLSRDRRRLQGRIRTFAGYEYEGVSSLVTKAMGSNFLATGGGYIIYSPTTPPNRIDLSPRVARQFYEQIKDIHPEYKYETFLEQLKSGELFAGQRRDPGTNPEEGMPVVLGYNKKLGGQTIGYAQFMHGLAAGDYDLDTIQANILGHTGYVDDSGVFRLRADSSIRDTIISRARTSYGLESMVAMNSSIYTPETSLSAMIAAGPEGEGHDVQGTVLKWSGMDAGALGIPFASKADPATTQDVLKAILQANTYEHMGKNYRSGVIAPLTVLRFANEYKLAGNLSYEELVYATKARMQSQQFAVDSKMAKQFRVSRILDNAYMTPSGEMRTKLPDLSDPDNKDLNQDMPFYEGAVKAVAEAVAAGEVLPEAAEKYLRYFGKGVNNRMREQFEDIAKFGDKPELVEEIISDIVSGGDISQFNKNSLVAAWAKTVNADEMAKSLRPDEQGNVDVGQYPYFMQASRYKVSLQQRRAEGKDIVADILGGEMKYDFSNMIINGKYELLYARRVVPKEVAMKYGGYGKTIAAGRNSLEDYSVSLTESVRNKFRADKDKAIPEGFGVGASFIGNGPQPVDPYIENVAGQAAREARRTGVTNTPDGHFDEDIFKKDWIAKHISGNDFSSEAAEMMGRYEARLEHGRGIQKNVSDRVAHQKRYEPLLKSALDSKNMSEYNRLLDEYNSTIPQFSFDRDAYAKQWIANNISGMTSPVSGGSQQQSSSSYTSNTTYPSSPYNPNVRQSVQSRPFDPWFQMPNQGPGPSQQWYTAGGRQGTPPPGSVPPFGGAAGAPFSGGGSWQNGPSSMYIWAQPSMEVMTDAFGAMQDQQRVWSNYKRLKGQFNYYPGGLGQIGEHMAGFGTSPPTGRTQNMYELIDETKKLVNEFSKNADAVKKNTDKQLEYSKSFEVLGKQLKQFPEVLERLEGGVQGSIIERMQSYAYAQKDPGKQKGMLESITSLRGNFSKRNVARVTKELGMSPDSFDTEMAMLSSFGVQKGDILNKLGKIVPDLDMAQFEVGNMMALSGGAKRSFSSRLRGFATSGILPMRADRMAMGLYFAQRSWQTGAGKVIGGMTEYGMSQHDIATGKFQLTGQLTQDSTFENIQRMLIAPENLKYRFGELGYEQYGGTVTRLTELLYNLPDPVIKGINSAGLIGGAALTAEMGASLLASSTGIKALNYLGPISATAGVTGKLLDTTLALRAGYGILGVTGASSVAAGLGALAIPAALAGLSIYGVTQAKKQDVTAGEFSNYFDLNKIGEVESQYAIPEVASQNEDIFKSYLEARSIAGEGASESKIRQTMLSREYNAVRRGEGIDLRNPTRLSAAEKIISIYKDVPLEQIQGGATPVDIKTDNMIKRAADIANVSIPTMNKIYGIAASYTDKDQVTEDDLVYFGELYKSYPGGSEAALQVQSSRLQKLNLPIKDPYAQDILHKLPLTLAEQSTWDMVVGSMSPMQRRAGWTSPQIDQYALRMAKSADPFSSQDPYQWAEEQRIQMGYGGVGSGMGFTAGTSTARAFDIQFLGQNEVQRESYVGAYRAAQSYLANAGVPTGDWSKTLPELRSRAEAIAKRDGIDINTAYQKASLEMGLGGPASAVGFTGGSYLGGTYNMIGADNINMTAQLEQQIAAVGSQRTMGGWTDMQQIQFKSRINELTKPGGKYSAAEMGQLLAVKELSAKGYSLAGTGVYSQGLQDIDPDDTRLGPGSRFTPLTDIAGNSATQLFAWQGTNGQWHMPMQDYNDAMANITGRLGIAQGELGLYDSAYNIQRISDYYGAGGFGERSMALSAAQTASGIGFARRRLGIQGALLDLSMRQYGYQYGYKMEEMERSRGWQLRQRQWTEEDLGRSVSRFGVQSTWQVEDIDRAIKYSSGRERRNLFRQRERLLTQQSWKRSDFARQGSRLEESQAREDEQYERRLDYEKQINEYALERFDLQKGQLALSQEELDAQASFAKEQQNLREDQFKKEQAYNLGRINYLKEIQKKEAERLDLQKKWIDDIEEERKRSRKAMEDFIRWLYKETTGKTLPAFSDDEEGGYSGDDDYDSGATGGGGSSSNSKLRGAHGGLSRGGGRSSSGSLSTNGGGGGDVTVHVYLDGQKLANTPAFTRIIATANRNLKL